MGPTLREEAVDLKWGPKNFNMFKNEVTRTTQNLWDAVLRRKFIAIQPFLKKQEKSQKQNKTKQKPT